jgi:hypothetical protein
MFTAYSCPTPSASAIASSSAGQAFITLWTDLFNARPADPTRIQWCSGAQTTSSFVDLQFTLATPTVMRCFGINGMNVLGLTDSSGIKIVITGKRSGDTGYPYDLGGTTQTTRTVKRDDGSIAALSIGAAGLTALVGYQVRIYNDQNSAATITASQFVDLGKVWASPGFDLDIDTDWKLSPGGIKIPSSINYQPWPVLYPPGRTLNFSRREMDFNTAYVTGSNPSWQSLCTLIGRGQPSILITRWGTAAAPDIAKIHATAVYGMAQLGEIEHFPGDYFSVVGSSVETPALLAS